MSGDFRPGGRVTLVGKVTVYPAEEEASSFVGKRLRLRTHLALLFNAEGRQRLSQNQFFSNILTPTGLPVEHPLCCYSRLANKNLEPEPLRLNRDTTLTASFQHTVRIPEDAPPGVYALGLNTWYPEITDNVSIGGPRIRQHHLHEDFALFPPFSIGEHDQPRLHWA